MYETIASNEAPLCGLIDGSVAAAALRDRAETVRATLAAGPTRAFGETRRLLLSASDQPLETQLEIEAQALARIAASVDSRRTDGVLGAAQASLQGC